MNPRLRPSFFLLIFFIFNTLSVQAIQPTIWSPRFGQAATVFKDKIWVAGGDDDVEEITPILLGENSGKNDVWSTTDGKNWICVTRKAPWVGRYGHSITAFRGKLWVMGGYHREKNEYKFDGPLNDVWNSSDGSSWTLVTKNAPWHPRCYHQTVVFHDKLWVIGGESGPDWPKNDIWSSEDGIKWQLMMNDTPWRTHEGFAAIVKSRPNEPIEGQSIYVIAGTGSQSRMGVDRHENGVWVSMDGTHWTAKTDAAPFHYSSFAAVWFQNWIFFVFGGRTDRQSSYFPQIWGSKEGRDWGLWDSCAPWGPRALGNAVVLNNIIYLLGGVHRGNLTNDIWCSKDGSNWTQIKPEKNP